VGECKGKRELRVQRTRTGFLIGDFGSFERGNREILKIHTHFLIAYESGNIMIVENKNSGCRD
jgi:hypothetical protein